MREWISRRPAPHAPACAIKRFFIFCAVLALFHASSPLAEGIDPSQALEYSRIIDVPGAGPLPYYAQNDPEWARSIYEPVGSQHFRRFQNTGCGPTAAAMAIARQLPAERLPELIAHARDPEKGYVYCACSINGYRCDRSHELTVPTTGEDFRSHLPPIFAAYAAGNNAQRAKYRTETTATSITLFPSLAECYNLHYASTRSWEEAYTAVQAGCSVITTVGSGLFTPVSHYLFIASIDEDYVYILDPFMRENYDELDKKHCLEVVEPGLVRSHLSNLDKLGFSGYYIISAEEIELQ